MSWSGCWQICRSTVFTASDSLGWVYQFWQAKKKAEVNKSEVKIGADELPAVTQLFTEPYMVQFLLHNTLGGWWVGRHGRESLPVEMPYLRFLGDGTPAAGIFDGWPQTTGELKVLDPCCGSGHFLVAAFEILVRFRMAEEGLAPADACAAVLRDNLHGLEIDERCTQIAAFALALTAWTFPGSGGYRVLPEMHIACSGLAPRATKSEWLALAGDDVRLRNGMEKLYELFQDAPVLGSLIDPTTVGLFGKQQELGVARFEELRPLLDSDTEWASPNSDAQQLALGVTAKGVTKALALLGGSFTLVVTNVPYLLRGKQSDALRLACERYYAKGAADLATVFVERCRGLCARRGTHATVTPQNWLFLGSYEDMRRELLTTQTLDHVTKIGSGATAVASWDVLRALAIVSVVARPDGPVTGLEAADPTESGRAEWVRCGQLLSSSQARQLSNPDARISLTTTDPGPLLNVYAESLQGTSTGDSSRFVAKFWEIPLPARDWEYWQSTVRTTTPWGGREQIVFWEGGSGDLVRSSSSAVRGLSARGHRGVSVTQMRALPCTLFEGTLFDTNAAAPLSRRTRITSTALWLFCSSALFNQEFVE